MRIRSVFACCPGWARQVSAWAHFSFPPNTHAPPHPLTSSPPHHEANDGVISLGRREERLSSWSIDTLMSSSIQFRFPLILNLSNWAFFNSLFGVGAWKWLPLIRWELNCHSALTALSQVSSEDDPDQGYQSVLSVHSHAPHHCRLAHPHPSTPRWVAARVDVESEPQLDGEASLRSWTKAVNAAARPFVLYHEHLDSPAVLMTVLGLGLDARRVLWKHRCSDVCHIVS